MADDKALTGKEWVEEVQISGRDFYYMAYENLEKRASRLGKKIYSALVEGTTSKPTAEIARLLAEAGTPVTRESVNLSHPHMVSFQFVGEDYVGRYEDCELSYQTYNADIKSSLDAAIVKFMRPHKSVTGKVYMLAQGHNGQLCFDSIGIAGHPIVRTNYSEKTLEAYDHFVEELESDDPCGRLCVLTGPTGTGKTHLIKGMINSDEANFAFIPPQMVSSISGPQIIRAVKDFSVCNPGKPLVFVLEDADECLVPRGSDNISSISSILNASEGILGQLMNIRIIATTNADIKKLDSAITRDGRLCARAEVGKLTAEHATRVLAGLLGKKYGQFADDGESPISSDKTLAEVYKIARGRGWSGKGTKSVKPIDNAQSGANLGFSMPSPSKDD